MFVTLWNSPVMYFQNTLSTITFPALYGNSTCKDTFLLLRIKSTDMMHEFRYGFHKVNKSPRGHRTLAENQIWEFSHAKFLRNRPDLLDDIKRKAMESSDTARRETGDLHAHLAMMQVAQSDMMQQIGHLFENFNELVKELAETRRKQASQQQMMKNMAQYISQQNGGNYAS